jgi:hypothetical protein
MFIRGEVGWQSHGVWLVSKGMYHLRGSILFTTRTQISFGREYFVHIKTSNTDVVTSKRITICTVERKEPGITIVIFRNPNSTVLDWVDPPEHAVEFVL